MGKSGFCSFKGKFPQAEIRGEKSVAVAGLGVVAKGTPSIFFRFFHDSRANRVQVNIGQAVDQCFPVIHDHALKPLGPEEAFSSCDAGYKTGKTPV